MKVVECVERCEVCGRFLIVVSDKFATCPKGHTKLISDFEVQANG